MTRMAATQAQEFEVVKQLLSPRHEAGPSPSHVVAPGSRVLESKASAQRSFWILIGTLLVASSSSRGGWPSSIKFSAGIWTSLAFGFEILLGRSFGRPQHVFRTFRVITTDDRVWHACALGELEEMERLFADGQASPYDQTDFGANLLHVCINVFY